MPRYSEFGPSSLPLPRLESPVALWIDLWQRQLVYGVAPSPSSPN
jgi:hypothetical protein